MYKNVTRKWLVAALFALGASGAHATVINFEALINGEQAVPPNPGPAQSQATLVLASDTHGYLLTWRIAEVVPFFDSPVLFAHFHGPANPGSVAGIQAWICDNTGGGPAGTPGCGGPGDDPFAEGSALLTPGQANQIRRDMWYVNIHTEEFQGGEIRGQVLEVPEPTMLALFALGLLGAAVTCRPRRSRSRI